MTDTKGKNNSSTSNPLLIENHHPDNNINQIFSDPDYNDFVDASFINNKNKTATTSTTIDLTLLSSPTKVPTQQPILIQDSEGDGHQSSAVVNEFISNSIQSPTPVETTFVPNEKDYQDMLLLMALSDYEDIISEADAMISMSNSRRFQVNILI